MKDERRESMGTFRFTWDICSIFVMVTVVFVLIWKRRELEPIMPTFRATTALYALICLLPIVDLTLHRIHIGSTIDIALVVAFGVATLIVAIWLFASTIRYWEGEISRGSPIRRNSKKKGM